MVRKERVLVLFLVAGWLLGACTCNDDNADAEQEPGLPVRYKNVAKGGPFVKIGPAQSDPGDPGWSALAESGKFNELVETVGIEAQGDRVVPLIPKGYPAPTSYTVEMSTAADNQVIIELRLMAGNSENAGDCRTLFKALVLGFPPRPAGVPRIEVTFEVERDGKVAVKARYLGDKTSG